MLNMSSFKIAEQMFFGFDSKPFKFKYKNSWTKWECFSLKKPTGTNEEW